MSNKSKVLLVEDIEAMARGVQAALDSLCQVTWVTNLGDTNKALENDTFSLLLLDVGLPDGDGFAFCKTVRAQERYRELPIIFITGQSDVDNRVRGFDVGADDYIVKPFEHREFVARIRSKLNRNNPLKATDTFSLDRFRVDLVSQSIFMKNENQEAKLVLTPIEFKLLANFLKNEGRVFSREELVKSIWGPTVHVSMHTVDTHISSLRKKMGVAGTNLKAVTKQGYCFIA